MFRIISTVLFSLFVLPIAMAQEHYHPPQDVQMHNEFYQKWKRNTLSCCNDKDCYATPAYFDEKLGLWKAQRREDKKWLTIEKWAYDPNNPHATESPDGRSHLCAPTPTESKSLYQGREFFCFIPGTQANLKIDPARQLARGFFFCNERMVKSSI